MASRIVFVCGLLIAVVHAQYRQQTTPVPILKQINKHNEDGSYSYGYEGADGAFKIETKYPTGEVYGKYGYVDDTGRVREVEYGASRRGFEPAGDGIQVAPPTLNNNHNNVNDDYDDGQYREDPRIYERQSSQRSFSGSSRPSLNFDSFNNFQSQPRHNSAPRYQAPAQNHNQGYQAPAHNYNQGYQAPPQAPRFIKTDPNQFAGHPATNFDVNTGSYSVNYSG